MSWFESASFKYPTEGSSLPRLGAQQTALAQLGAMSPLWALFMGASTMGVAYWSMTRWMQLATPAKVAGSVVKLRLVKSEPLPAAVPAPEVEPAAVEELKAPEPVTEAVEAAVETVAESAETVAETVEAVAETAAKPVAKAKPVRVAKAKAPVKAVAPEAAPAAPAAKTTAPRKPSVRKPAAKA